MDKYSANISKSYGYLINKVAALYGLNRSDAEIFYLTQNPALRKKIEKEISAATSVISNNIKAAAVNGWEGANEAYTEEQIKRYGKTVATLLTKKSQLYLQAKSAFIKDLDKRLSQRIWKLEKQIASEMELAMQVGFKNGIAATKLATEMKQYLKNPDKLFRRVRDEFGQLHLSKAAKAYHPGRGVYRSSYKNALRLVGEENNRAARTSDHHRRLEDPFVIGIEIGLSNNHTLNGIPFVDMCDRLAGRYPKDYLFTGWHVKCRCKAKSIFCTDEEFDQITEDILDGGDGTIKSKNEITGTPKNFNKWIKDNDDRIKRAKSLPYFIRDNKKYVSHNSVSSIPAKKALSRDEVVKILEKKENIIRKNKSFETAYAVTDNGVVVLDKKGQSTSVGFNKEEVLRLKDTFFTHNHPRGWKAPEGSMRRIGNSFSPADIGLAIKSDMKEIRAVTPNYTFSMQRPIKGWPDLDVAKKDIISFNNKVYDDFMKKIDDGITTMGKAEVVHFHTLWKLFCKKHGITYTKKKTI